MNRRILFCLLISTAGTAFAAKPCEELKAEIAAKLDANHVAGYTLEIVSKSDDGAGKVVGTCEGGTKKIVYSHTAANTDGATGASGGRSAPDDAKQ